MGFEYLHYRTDHMEDEDNLGLVPCLKPEGEHDDLHKKRAQEQEIIAGDQGVRWPEEIAAQD